LQLKFLIISYVNSLERRKYVAVWFSFIQERIQCLPAIRILFTNYDIITDFLNLAFCSEHFISIKHWILATFNINKQFNSDSLCTFNRHINTTMLFLPDIQTPSMLDQVLFDIQDICTPCSERIHLDNSNLLIGHYYRCQVPRIHQWQMVVVHIPVLKTLLKYIWNFIKLF
jgi:hypothetical protein